MFIVVRFGADEEQLFNPDCAIRVLMVDIKKRCRCNCSAESISLFDEKTKSVVKIPDGGPNSMDDASSYFTDRGSYILLKTDKSDSGIKYKILLDEPSKELTAFIEALSIGPLGKPVKSSHSRKTSKTPQPSAAKQGSGSRHRRK